MSDQVGVALIGCGYWGMNYVRVFSELEQSRVAVVCDQREERLEEVARRFPGVAVTTDLGEALRMDGVRAAVVATPASTHHQVTRECLEAGKHILVEKPITTNSIEAEDLIRVAELNELTLMVGHTFLYNPAIWTVKEHMDQGELGRVY
ncbi:MAG TPA: Gfo/Idh/MocA family oxidoreductase, partial [Ardenticatenaceae bacterium]|nr:Gfo/Idh/MocA family oxidoreductase [Ardenticatenaceae bacterium]